MEQNEQTFDSRRSTRSTEAHTRDASRSGGPLVILSSAGQKYQIGIVSMADDCSTPGAVYGIYTRVSSYVDWIKQVVPNVLSEPMTEVKR